MNAMKRIEIVTTHAINTLRGIVALFEMNTLNSKSTKQWIGLFIFIQMTTILDEIQIKK